MSAAKKQRLLTQYVLLSDDDSSQELTETVPSAASTSDGDDMHQLKLT